MTNRATTPVRKKCRICLTPFTKRCQCARGNRPSGKPKGGAAIVGRYGVPQSVVRERRARQKPRAIA